MKKKNALLVLVLLLGTMLCLSSCDKYRHPTGRSYVYTMEIDSTASACGVDSCVVNIPWIKNEIDAFLSDSAERKLKFETSLTITQYLCADTAIEDENVTYFECTMSDKRQSGTLWLDCNGDTIWIDPDYTNTETHPYNEATNIEFGDSLWHSGVIMEYKAIVRVAMGFLPCI